MTFSFKADQFPVCSVVTDLKDRPYILNTLKYKDSIQLHCQLFYNSMTYLSYFFEDNPLYSKEPCVKLDMEFISQDELVFHGTNLKLYSVILQKNIKLISVSDFLDYLDQSNLKNQFLYIESMQEIESLGERYDLTCTVDDSTSSLMAEGTERVRWDRVSLILGGYILANHSSIGTTNGNNVAREWVNKHFSDQLVVFNKKLIKSIKRI